MYWLEKILILFILISSDLLSQLNVTENSGLNSISGENIRRHMQFLASDIFEGRGTGENGGNLAAKYLALEYAKYGLIPIGDENTFYQYIPMHGSFALKSSVLKLYSETTETELRLNQDYLLYKTGQQTYTPVPLPLVFVSYGIIAPEFDYNDYQSVDVEGKIVVFLGGEPHSDDPVFFDGDAPTVYSYPESKQRLAISRGAAGSILIPVHEDFYWEEQIKEFSSEDVTLAYSVSSNFSILINPEIANQIFYKSRYSYTEVMKMQEEGNVISFPLMTKISFKGDFKQRDFLAPNIIGMIEGSDSELKDSYIVVSAHYDHLGVGIPVNGDSIYNGALDNAIGTAALLELSRIFSGLELPPKRSIIFIALTGEEKGLLGSTYYTDHPVVPLYKTIANINIDGIALFRNFQSIVGIGSEYSTLESYLDSTASSFNISMESIPPQFKKYEAFNRSDQIAFANAGIPSILVLEGLKNKNKSKDEILSALINYMKYTYHSPFDDLNQEIDYEAAEQHTQIIFDLCNRVANSDELPEWKPGAPFISARLRSIAERR